MNTSLHMAVPAGDLAAFGAVLAELGAGGAVAEPVGTSWVDG